MPATGSASSTKLSKVQQTAPNRSAHLLRFCEHPKPYHSLCGRFDVPQFQVTSDSDDRLQQEK